MTGSLTVGAVVLAVGIGLLATLVMNVPMNRLPEGKMPPSVAAGVLADTHPDDAPDRLATAVHYVAGGGTGVLFLMLVTMTSVVLPSGVVGALGAYLLAGALLLGLMVGFFVLVPLPRAGSFARQRLRAIKRSWTIAAAVYVIVVVVMTGVLIGV